MASIRHMFPGGNTCYGFYSFYDHIVSTKAQKKIVLKGGPGVGKSTFMKALGKDFENKNFDVEYHWCSSDNDSLDAVVIGDNKICLLDGTAPHVVDPRYPGAVDEIINLGDYWNEESIKSSRDEIIELTNKISLCFNRAYIRLKEVNMAYNMLESYYQQAVNIFAVNRNIVELSEYVTSNIAPSSKNIRHLFSGAITPGGIVTKADSLIDSDYKVCGIKGSPGIGTNKLFAYILNTVDVNGGYAEVFHNPFNPDLIDIIIIPDNKTVLIDTTGLIVDYEKNTTIKYKRLLDFDQFLDTKTLSSYEKNISNTLNRFNSGLLEAIECIEMAKKYHDDLESYYIPAMNFDNISILRKDLLAKLQVLI